MKQPRNRSNPHTASAPVEGLFCRGVRYTWSASDGTIHHGNTVLTSSTRAGLRFALRRLFQTNDHVQPQEA